MIKLNLWDAFIVLRQYLQAEVIAYGSSIVEVSDILSDTDLDTWTDGLPAVPSSWLSWNKNFQFVSKNPTDQVQKSSIILLTAEQAYVALNCFLESRYWNKNNDITVPEVLKDIENQFKNRSIEETELWEEWVACGTKASKFEKIFDQNEKRG